MTGSSFGSSINELTFARRVKISGNWAFVMTGRLGGGSEGDCRLVAIDITNPARPFTTGDYVCADVADSKFIDFDIHGETAYVLAQREAGA